MAKEEKEKQEKHAKTEKQDKKEKPGKKQKAQSANEKAKAAKEGGEAVKAEKHAVTPRLKLRYKSEIVPFLMKHLGYKNPMQVPVLVKVVVNMGVGDAAKEIKFMDKAMHELSLITGQKPLLRRAKKSISAFKLRQNDPIGCKVTLRGNRMYEFLDKLFSIAIPRFRDFRGLSVSSFDGKGNYTLGIREQLVFPEIDYDHVDKVRGMDITIVTTAKTNNEAKALLSALGMPFAKNEQEKAMRQQAGV